MKLEDLIDNERTDKNTRHSYLPVYQELFDSKRISTKNILEIGIGPFEHCNGASIKLWHDFFPNAQIYGVDINPYEIIWDKVKNNDRIILYTSTDGYKESWFEGTFLKSNIRFDIAIDDGPHTLDSMIQFIELYSKVMKEDGIMVIEDVQDIIWVDVLKEYVPEHMKKYIEVYDLREKKDVYDDIMFVINMSKR